MSAHVPRHLRCSFSRGMRCVPRVEAITRMRAALAAAQECFEETGREILVVGRTDVRNDSSLGAEEAFKEAMYRAQVVFSLLSIANEFRP